MTDIRQEILEAIEKAHPDNIVEMSIGFDESYLRDNYPKLKKALSQIEGTELSYERDAEGNQLYPEQSEAENEMPDWVESSSSYHLFFVGLVDEEFRYLCETVETEEEDGYERRVEGEGMIGCIEASRWMCAAYAGGLERPSDS